MTNNTTNVSSASDSCIALHSTPISRRSVMKLGGGVAAAALMPNLFAMQEQRQQSSLVLVSRHLQWTNWREGIEVAKEAGYSGILWTVRSGAHVEPENVTEVLPEIVEATRAAGLSVPMIITQINGVNVPHIEAMLETFRELGIRGYRAGAPRYNYARDFRSQHLEMSRNMQALAELNAKYDVSARFHTHSSSGGVGGSVWDLWMIMKDIDPRYISINCDIGHITARNGNGWLDAMHAAREHIGSLTIKDVRWSRIERPDETSWPWDREFVPPGEGMVDFRGVFNFLKETGFAGPIGVYHEYLESIPGTSEFINMLGSNYGSWQLEVPKDYFISLLKRDVDFYRAVARDTGFELV